MTSKKNIQNLSRRNFIKASTAAGIATLVSRSPAIFAAGSDTLKIGIIGCGGRGTGAAINCVESSSGIHITAMADLFQDKLDSSLEKLKKKLKEKMLAEAVMVTEENCFTGFDAYKKLLATDVDVVILACPPGFRPVHYNAAVEAGKHIFMEKPVAVDPVGVRSVIAASEIAGQKSLAVVAGTQRRHQEFYLEIMKRIHNGDIGDIVAAQCYWMGGGMLGWKPEPDPKYSDMELQCRRWYFYDWICGDHIVEQHVHNLDVVNWAIGDHPVRCIGMGGRQFRTDEKYGNIWDHFAVEYEYPNGARVLSMCRHTEGATNRVTEHITGTLGKAHTDSKSIEGCKPYKFEGEPFSPYIQEHADLIASIRQGKPLNEGKRVAESTLTAIMGRMSAYTGRALNWNWVMNESKLDLSPPKYEFGDLPVRPIPVPGKTELI